MKEETKQVSNVETLKKNILHNVFFLRNISLSK